MLPLFWLFLASVILSTPVVAYGEGRHVVLILDTSGSMNKNDPSRNTLRAAQIIADLLDEKDRVAVIRLPTELEPTCEKATAKGALLRVCTPPGLEACKEALSSLPYKANGTQYLTPLLTARDDFFQHRAEYRERLLIFLSDGQPTDEECGDRHREAIEQMADLGVRLATIGLGEASSQNLEAFGGYHTTANNGAELTLAFANLFDRFLGNRDPRNGPAGASLPLEIRAHTHRAWLVVTSEGPPPALSLEPQSPAVKSSRTARAGTVSSPQGPRSYRILELEQPEAGLFTVRISGEKTHYFLLQDFGLSPEFLGPEAVMQNDTPLLKARLVDLLSDGQTVTSKEQLQQLKMNFQVGAQSLALQDNGEGGDEKAGDGIFSARALTADGRPLFTEVGRVNGTLEAENAFLKKTVPIQLEVKSVTWTLELAAPDALDVGTDGEATLSLRPAGAAFAGVRVPKLEAVTARFAGFEVKFLDDGQGSDKVSGDGFATAQLHARRVGLETLHAEVTVEGQVLRAEKAIAVLSRLKLSAPPPLDFGIDNRGGETLNEQTLDLSASEVVGEFVLQASIEPGLTDAQLEVKDADGVWQVLEGKRTARLVLDASHRNYAVRLRVGRCARASDLSMQSGITLRALDPMGREVSVVAPLVGQIQGESFFACYGAWLLILPGVLGALFILYGFYWPARFSPRLAISLADKASDLEFLSPIPLKRRGVRIGWYRHARACIHGSFQVNGKERGAWVVLRAGRHGQNQVLPKGGISLWLEDPLSDTGWLEVPREETPMKLDEVYRCGEGALFFKVTLR